MIRTCKSIVESPTSRSARYSRSYARPIMGSPVTRGSPPRREVVTYSKSFLMENTSVVEPVAGAARFHRRRVPTQQPYLAVSFSSLSPVQYRQKRPQHEQHSGVRDGPLPDLSVSINVDDHREAMRLFLDSLHFATAAVSTSATTSVPVSKTDVLVRRELLQKRPQRRQQESREQLLQQKLHQPPAPWTAESSSPVEVIVEDEDRAINNIQKVRRNAALEYRRDMAQEQQRRPQQQRRQRTIEPKLQKPVPAEGTSPKVDDGVGISESLLEGLGDTTLEDRGKSEAARLKAPDSSDCNSLNESERFAVDIYGAVQQGNVETAVKLFRKARKEGVLLDKKVATNLFFSLSTKNPLAAYEVLKYCNTHPNNGAGKKTSMYKRMCAGVGLLDPCIAPPRDRHSFVESLLDDVQLMDDSAKETLYPILVVSFATQRCVSLGPYAGQIFEAMVENGYEMKPAWLIFLLSLSKYNRQDDLPFHNILAQLAAMGVRPHPTCTLPAIHNMFPYTDTARMCVTLRAWLDFEAKEENVCQELQSGSKKKDNYTIVPFEHRLLDLSTLEMVSMGAARAADSKLIMLVWDVLEHCEYMPTETIYENTVVAFASGAKKADGIRQAFMAMASMKDDGFAVSRALIRSLSKAIRSEQQTVDTALQILLDDQALFNGRGRNTCGSLMSLEALNVVMSSYAERGETEQTISILQTMQENGIQANDDSYSFAMEALGKDIRRRNLVGDPSYMHKNLEIASIILTRMEEEGVAPSADIIRNYVELLCLADEVETATIIVEDFVADRSLVARVNNKTIYRVAMANAEAGNITKAKELAEKTSEYIHVLHRKIKAKEMDIVALNRSERNRERNV